MERATPGQSGHGQVAQDCVPPPHRLLLSGLGSALPLERARDGALQRLIPVLLKGSIMVSIT